MTRVLVAAIAALLTVISAPASAQCPPCPQGKPCPTICFPLPKPTPTPTPTPIPTPTPPPQPRVHQPRQQPVYQPPPQPVYPPPVYRHVCVVPGAGSCLALG